MVVVNSQLAQLAMGWHHIGIAGLSQHGLCKAMDCDVQLSVDILHECGAYPAAAHWMVSTLCLLMKRVIAPLDCRECVPTKKLATYLLSSSLSAGMACLTVQRMLLLHMCCHGKVVASQLQMRVSGTAPSVTMSMIGTHALLQQKSPPMMTTNHLPSKT